MIVENIKQVEENIKQACEKVGRNPEEVTLISVSKTKPYTAIEEALPSGILDYGENKVQELCDKFDILPKNIRWHMIGHLQRNKVKYLVGKVQLIHSVDSLRLAEQIEKAPTFISSIETGQRGMSIETFVSIANALNVSADALLIDSIENTERISGSFFAAAAFDCNEFERRVLLELLIASKEAIRKNKRFLRYEDAK